MITTTQLQQLKVNLCRMLQQDGAATLHRADVPPLSVCICLRKPSSDI